MTEWLMWLSLPFLLGGKMFLFYRRHPSRGCAYSRMYTAACIAVTRLIRWAWFCWPSLGDRSEGLATRAVDAC